MGKDIPPSIIIAFNEGSAAAFQSLYPSLYNYTLVIGRKYLGSDEAIDDFSAKALASLWEARGNFLTIEKIKFYLYTVVRNASLEYLRKEQRHRLHHNVISGILETEELPTEGPDDGEVNLAIQLERAINSLPRKCQVIFRMAFIEQLRNQVIAKRLGISEKTVRNQKVLGKNRVKIKLIDPEDNPHPNT